MEPQRDPFLVHHFLERNAARRPDAPFLIQGGEARSYARVERGANRVARFLLQEGIRRGDRVGLLFENSPGYVEAYYGALKAGCVAVPLNTAADASSLQGFLSDCEARALLVGPRLWKPLAQVVADLPRLELLVVLRPERLGTPPAWLRVHDAEVLESFEDDSSPGLSLIDLDPASIIYTSGSTGRPRGATLSHLNICTNTRSIVRYLKLTSEDRVLQVLPFFYVFGKSLLNTHAACGGAVVIENRFMFPNVALDTLERERCTGFSGVPSTYAILLNRSNLAERELCHLRYVTQAGGPMSPEHTRRLMKALPSTQIFVMYGATEASARLCYLDPEQLPDKIGSVGKAIPNVEMRILREDGADADVGEVGELVARGANIMSGYWGDPEATEEVLGPQGYRTGDLGKRDEDGFLYVVGRKRDMIKAGAHRISAREIENVVLEHPQVHETAVIGVPDELLGEAIQVYVVMREADPASPDPEGRDLMTFLRTHLPGYKVPSTIMVMDDLPKNSSGKIMKERLREMATSSGRGS
jgi:long-chain acyl-CoA synthetase